VVKSSESLSNQQQTVRVFFFVELLKAFQIASTVRGRSFLLTYRIVCVCCISIYSLANFRGSNKCSFSCVGAASGPSEALI